MNDPYEGIDKLSPSVKSAAKPDKIELTAWEQERYEKTGYIRWQSILHFYTIDCTKAGYLRKQKGVWYLTEEEIKIIEND